MKKSRFTDQQIAFALKQAETGTPFEEVCRKLGISQQTFYRWKKNFAGLGTEELRLVCTTAIVDCMFCYGVKAGK